MSKDERVVSDPEAAGWEFDPATGYWMWKGEEGTGGLWEANGDDIYYSDGNVGIGNGGAVSAIGPRKTVEIEGASGSGIRLSQTGAGDGFVSADTTHGLRLRSNITGAEQIVFETSTLERMRIDADGGVNIGNSASVEEYNQLQVTAVIARITIKGDGADSYAQQSFRTDKGAWAVGMRPEHGSSLVVRSNVTGLIPMSIDADGNTTFYGSVTVDGEIRGKQNVIAYYSDVRLKDIQGPIENPVEKVKAIETFYYTHGDRARELGYEGSEIQVGVSAQSVQAVAPELIHRAPVDDDGEGGSVTGESYMTVDYPRLVPFLIESIKQLSAEIDELKK